VTYLEYVDYLLAQGLSPKTVGEYQRKIRQSLEWCSNHRISLFSATPSDLVGLASIVPASASSRRQLRSALQHWWDWMGRPDPPVKAIRVPRKPPGRCRALEPAQARDLVKHAIGWHPEGLAVLLGMYAALRVAEIASSRWDRIDGDTLTVMGKGDRTRYLPIHPVLGSELDTAHKRSRSEWLFPGSRGRPYVTTATVWGWCKTVAAGVGIEGMQTHQLRHSCLATMNDGTGDLRATQEFAGHARPETTSIYTRVTAQRLTDAVLALDYLA
jgi:site-specific recombinase XerD